MLLSTIRYDIRSAIRLCTQHRVRPYKHQHNRTENSVKAKHSTTQRRQPSSYLTRVVNKSRQVTGMRRVHNRIFIQAEQITKQTISNHAYINHKHNKQQRLQTTSIPAVDALVFIALLTHVGHSLSNHFTHILDNRFSGSDWLLRQHSVNHKEITQAAAATTSNSSNEYNSNPTRQGGENAPRHTAPIRGSSICQTAAVSYAAVHRVRRVLLVVVAAAAMHALPN